MSPLHGAIVLMTKLTLDRSPVPDYQAPLLDEQQLKVVAHRSGALRVLAGPGTGKTTTLVAAMAGRLSGLDALKPENVLGLTFGRKAALDWRDQVTRAVGGGIVPTVSTFHSFCYALLRKYAPQEAYEIATRLLSGPEQQVAATELFIEAVNKGRIHVPDDIKAAISTRGLAEEIRAVMAQTRSHLMDPEDLVALGRENNRPLWTMVGEFMEEYLDVLALNNVMDYSELIYRAVLLTLEPEVRDYLQATYKAIYVDEYQDTDPGQVEFLKRIITSETSLVVVGDFDQAIYGFRGADESGIRLFKDQFQHVYGNAIDDVILRHTRRFGENIWAAGNCIIGGWYPRGFTDVQVDEHRRPLSMATNPGVVRIQKYDSDGAQAAHIADQIIRKHVHDDVPWSDMAVIVRSAVVTLPGIYRALVTAGVPVEIAADEIPLHQDPAVEPLITLLKVVDNSRALTPEIAETILTGPLGRLDMVDLRRFGRFLRKQERDQGKIPAPYGALIAQALAQPADIFDIDNPEHAHVVNVISTLGELIVKARTAMQTGATPHEVLWLLWQGSTWPEVLQRQALGFGGTSQRAHRDLDSICALFDFANRFVGKGRTKDLTVFLADIEAQQIPAETLAEHDVRNNTVRLLTAHRAKGLQWPIVFIAGAQEDLWPNLRVPQTLMQANRIDFRAMKMPMTTREVLETERRLFFVALTRAQHELVLTAVENTRAEEVTGVSRFVETIQERLGIEPEIIRGRPHRPMSADGVVARLRTLVQSPDTSVDMKQAAAFKLRELMESGEPMFAAAHPDTWWASRAVTQNHTPPSEPVRLSSTRVNDIEECAAKWFLTREARATNSRASHLLFGSALHAIAQALAEGALPSDIALIDEHLDRIWPGMGYQIAWEANAERSQAHEASVRLLGWLAEHADNSAIVESQLSLTKSIVIADSQGNSREVEISISGRADRIEFAADGVTVYDFKTAQKELKKTEVLKGIQLALYTLMVQEGEYEKNKEKRRLDSQTSVKGAALVYLRLNDGAHEELPLVQFAENGAHDRANKNATVGQRLASAAQIIVNEQYATTYTEFGCARCEVRFMCPAVPQGRQVLS